MNIDFLKEVFNKNKFVTAIIWKDKAFSYEWLQSRVSYWNHHLPELPVYPGEVISLIGDFSPECIAILLALVNNRNIIVPLNNVKFNYSQKFKIAQVEKVITVDEADQVIFECLDIKADNIYFNGLRLLDTPGLVLFTSGTSGVPKGAVHNFSKLLEKFKIQRRALRTVNFLMFDHWGGLNTMFHTLSNAGIILATKNLAVTNGLLNLKKHRWISMLLQIV